MNFRTTTHHQCISFGSLFHDRYPCGFQNFQTHPAIIQKYFRIISEFSTCTSIYVMKRLFVLTMVGLISFSSSGQDSNHKANRYSIGAQYNHEFILGGYVRVREWELPGDKMKLKDLGVTSYPALQLKVERHFRKGRSLSITYDHYLMSGTSTFNRDIAYNGTIINGRNGIDVSPTRHFRFSAGFSGPLVDRSHFDLRYKGSLVIDHITFYLDGDVSPSSTRNEVYEGFGRQAFPYPVVGVEGKVELNAKSDVNVEVSGSYIPKFRSFYTEGGDVFLQYQNFLAMLSYSRRINDFEIAAGTKLRYLYLFQESKEDTNIISTLTTGPFLEVSYHF